MSQNDSKTSHSRSNIISKKPTRFWDTLSAKTQKAIIYAVNHKRVMFLRDGKQCKLDAIGANDDSIICKTGLLFKDTVPISLKELFEYKNMIKYDSGNNVSKQEKRGGSNRRTKRLRKNKKKCRTRRSKQFRKSVK
jgi:hypothetical protein